MSTADYDWEEVESLLTTIADAFHTIGQEYEKLVGIVPQMSKVQVANMVARMPILPFLKQETKMEIKQGPAMVRAMEPVPSTSHEQLVMPEDARTAQTPSEVTEEEGAKKEDNDPEMALMDEYLGMFCWVKEEILKKKSMKPAKKLTIEIS